MQTEHGLVRTGEGWFIVNAREMRWYESEGWGKFSNFGGDILCDQLGIGLTLLGRGRPGNASTLTSSRSPAENKCCPSMGTRSRGRFGRSAG